MSNSQTVKKSEPETSAPLQVPRKTNYVLIDYENVQPDDIASLQQEHVRVIVFVGPHQTKIAIEKAAALQRMGTNAEYVRMSGGGSNALDFHIAYYLGNLGAKEPTASFHIISKDTGFDPLLKHLKERSVQAYRVQTIGELSFLKAKPQKIPVVKLATKAKVQKTNADKLAKVVASLQKRRAARPQKMATLMSTISAIFQKQISAAEVTSLVGDLKKKGFVKVDGTKVVYNLPA